jgi:hypothetical protein
VAKAKGQTELELGKFPPGTMRRSHRYVCLACIFDIFTKQLKLAPRTAYGAVRKHTPGVEELTGTAVGRPYFDSDEKHPHCPHCGAAKTQLARFDVIRLDGGRATAAARKELMDSLPKAEGQFEVVEEKANRKELLFQWLDELGRRLDLDRDEWLMEAARTYLEKREPKTEWGPVFEGLRQVRRSVQLEEGWERVGARLYLAPSLYDEVLLMQYLVSRSHKAGGRTFEGRLTIGDLLRRLRRSGYLREHEISGDVGEVLEQLVEALDPGGASMKMYYVVDRRDFLEKTRSVYAKYAT